MDTNIAILKMFPGITQNAVDAILNTKNVKAIILETFGSGNATTQAWFIDSLKKALSKGTIILNITQCNAGKVEQGKYATSAAFKKIGVIGGADITTEAAVAKLMYLLGNMKTKREIEKALQINMRGEISI